MRGKRTIRQRVHRMDRMSHQTVQTPLCLFSCCVGSGVHKTFTDIAHRHGAILCAPAARRVISCHQHERQRAPIELFLSHHNGSSLAGHRVVNQISRQLNGQVSLMYR